MNLTREIKGLPHSFFSPTGRTWLLPTWRTIQRCTVFVIWRKLNMEYSPPPCSFNYQQYGKGGDKFLQKCLADTYVTEKATPLPSSDGWLRCRLWFSSLRPSITCSRQQILLSPSCVWISLQSSTIWGMGALSSDLQTSVNPLNYM